MCSITSSNATELIRASGEPLRQADDAIVLDNSHLTHEEQFQFLLVHARKAMAGE